MEQSYPRASIWSRRTVTSSSPSFQRQFTTPADCFVSLMGRLTVFVSGTNMALVQGGALLGSSRKHPQPHRAALQGRCSRDSVNIPLLRIASKILNLGELDMSSPPPGIAGRARQAAEEQKIDRAIIRPEYRCEGGGKKWLTKLQKFSRGQS